MSADKADTKNEFDMIKALTIWIVNNASLRDNAFFPGYLRQYLDKLQGDQDADRGCTCTSCQERTESHHTTCEKDDKEWNDTWRSLHVLETQLEIDNGLPDTECDTLLAELDSIKIALGPIPLSGAAFKPHTENLQATRKRIAKVGATFYCKMAAMCYEKF